MNGLTEGAVGALTARLIPLLIAFLGCTLFFLLLAFLGCCLLCRKKKK